jgi:DNA-binding response OmpR family regulator
MILLVEDDLALRLAVGASLRAEGHEVVPLASAEEAAALVAGGAVPELVVLDWMLPGTSGIELLAAWRRQGLTFPVLLLTARDAVRDRIVGLDAGADDYVVKPFAMEELLARVRAQRRRAGTSDGSLRLSGCTVDLARGRVACADGREELLTTKELELLRYLAARPGVAVDREVLHREVWGHRAGLISRSADHTVVRLRAKVEEDPASPRHLLTVHGLGYRFEP